MPLKAGSQQNPLGQISVKWNEVKVKWKGEMKWNEKEEGGWGLHGPRGYCYPHYEPLEQQPTMTASQSRTNIVWEWEESQRRGGKDDENEKKINEWKKRRRKKARSDDTKYWQNQHQFNSELLLCFCDLFGAVWERSYVQKMKKLILKKENTIFFSLNCPLYLDFLW